MEYVLTVTRDGEPVLTAVITPDEVIDLMKKYTVNIHGPVFSTGPVVPENTGKRKYTKRGTKKVEGGRKCGSCGKSGHTVRTCPSEKPEKYGMDSDDDRQPASTRDPNRQPMSQDEFEDVLLKFKEEGNSRAVMDYFPDIPADEINLAIRVKNYRIYART